MAILVYAENKDGKFKKSAQEAVTYGADLAASLGLPVYAVSVGTVADADLQTLGKFGATKVLNLQHDQLAHFNDQAYTAAIAQAAQAAGATIVVLSQTYSGRVLGGRLAVRLDAAYFSGVSTLVSKGGDGYTARRTAFTSKAVEELTAPEAKLVVSVKSNGYKVKENPQAVTVEAVAFTPVTTNVQVAERKLNSGGLSLTEADIVVSAGRGIGNEQTFAGNWDKSVKPLAELLNAATASSKPVADVHWRPHHEHVGQTGVQISPNVYIALGISGAIQHLAGVSSSKTIIVVNKDPEAPFFKAADYGIVGDVNEVVPRLVDAIREFKAKQS